MRTFAIALSAALLAALATPSAQARPLPESRKSGNLRITPEMLSFSYRSFDGGVYVPCKAEIEDAASQDWLVVCVSEDRRTSKNFRVHLWVSLYSRNVVPKLSYEVLYWIMDRTNPRKIVGGGATTWFHLNEPTALHSLSSSQSVDEDTAGLYLDLKVPQ